MGKFEKLKNKLIADAKVGGQTRENFIEKTIDHVKAVNPGNPGIWYLMLRGMFFDEDSVSRRRLGAKADSEYTAQNPAFDPTQPTAARRRRRLITRRTPSYYSYEDPVDYHRAYRRLIRSRVVKR